MRDKKQKARVQMKGEIVSFETPDKIWLHGFLSKPKRRTEKMVIHLHGLQGSFYSSTGIRTLASAFAKSGFSFLAIEQRGSYLINDAWKGRGKRSRAILIGGALEKFEDSIYDIEGAVKFAREIGMKRVYLEGHSTGCQKITYYQSRRQNRLVKGLILIAPADDYNIIIKELGGRFDEAVDFARKWYKKDRNLLMPSRYRLKELNSIARFLSYADPKNTEAKIFNYDLERMGVLRRVKVPVLAIFGTREEYAIKPVKEYLKILERNLNAGMFTGVLIKGANHLFRKREELLASKITEWLEGQN